MSNLTIAYLTLTPRMKNQFAVRTHKLLFSVLNNSFPWEAFARKHPEFDLGFIVVTKEGVNELDVKGPSKSKKLKVVDYSVFLPEEDRSIDRYLELILKAIQLVAKQYDQEIDIINIKETVLAKL